MQTGTEKQRGLATALLDIKPRLLRVKSHRFLPQLRVALQQTIAREVTAAGSSLGHFPKFSGERD